MKIQNKGEMQQSAFNHSSDIYRRCKNELYSFLVNHATLPSDHPLYFRKNLIVKIV